MIQLLLLLPTLIKLLIAKTSPGMINPISIEEDDNQSWLRVALLVEYCGTSFQGSQFQPNRLTVQSTFQDALRKLNLETSAVSFAGRTDAGVHANGQVAHVDIAAVDNVPDLAKALNALLPDSVSVRSVWLQAGRSFNSRRDAWCKWYRYRIYNAANRSVWAQNTASTQYAPALDASRMQEAASLLLGRQNFCSFKSSDTDVVDDFCRVLHASVSQEGDFINFDIVADRFLYKMVRNIAGQLIAIGKSSVSPASILDVLANRDRRVAAATAPAEGLTLMAVLYPSQFNFFAQDSNVRQLEAMLNPTKMELSYEDLFRKAS
jgi:tRNA pseudouridine38-40 synthase